MLERGVAFGISCIPIMLNSQDHISCKVPALRTLHDVHSIAMVATTVEPSTVEDALPSATAIADNDDLSEILFLLSLIIGAEEIKKSNVLGKDRKSANRVVNSILILRSSFLAVGCWPASLFEHFHVPFFEHNQMLSSFYHQTDP
ncbi:hypothetical protein RHSIM_Rhsim13G0050800 [Rhododendron simsii]|uniref:Uncharacterized protein n=1 Tax=Rhododendron simsii TaxID=118357 RepID=A0A834FZS4_RHOSS|nr:hypothetical protein RHSIM_Rhsim13G0050800 [Rhododendron simsii]